MIQIHVKSLEFWDEKKQEFVSTPETDLDLEHSLYTIDKWESIWHKPFLSTRHEKTEEELKSYIKCMTMSKVPSDLIYDSLTSEDYEKINAYINNPMTATTIQRPKKSHSNQILTSEVLYYDMISLGIPFECQYWHLNKLITLIEVCDIKGSPQKKMSMKETMLSNKAINARNRARFNSKG